MCRVKDRTLQNFQNFFVTFEGRNQISAGKFGARPRQHFARNFEAAITRCCAGRFHGFQERLGNYNAGNFVVEAQRKSGWVMAK